MNRVESVVAILVGALGSAACSSGEYRPLAEGELVHMHVNGYNLPVVHDGVELRGDADTFIESPEGEFGIRATEDGEYLPDTFVVNNGLEEETLVCYLWQDRIPNNFEASVCRGSFKEAEPGRTMHVSFNDFDGSVVVMPELPELTSPKEDSEFSVGSGEELVLSWEPLGKGDFMRWLLVRIDTDEPGSCDGKTSWRASEGSMDDTGSLILPVDELPTDLPAEGCPVFLQISRGREGTVDPRIPQGSILARQFYKMRMTLKP